MSPLPKTSIPAPAVAIPRERLFRRLDAALSRRAVWIAGPPGAGKTTLLATYVAARGIECLWYHVDATDEDLGSFFFHLGAAADEGRPGRSPLPLFTPEYLGGEAAFARRFFRDLVPRDGTRLVLVFDDLNGVRRDAPLHAVLAEAIQELSPAAAVVLVSRDEPPPSFARAIANGLLERMGGEELVLSGDEALAVARAHAPAGTAPEDLRRACELAAGWTAGVVLLASRPGALDGGVPAARTVFDYLAGEIFDRTDPTTRRVLLRAALVVAVPAPLANALCGSTRAQDILDDLAARAYFTVRRGDPEVTFTLHPLLRGFLLARCRAELPPDELRGIRMTAAMLLERARHSDDAVSLFLDARAWDDAARLTLGLAPKLHATGRLATLEGWIRALPDDVRRRRPWLSYWLGVSRLPSDPEEARTHFAQVYSVFDASGDVAGACLTWAAIVDTFLRQWSDFRPMDEWLDRFEEFRRRRLPPPDPHVEHAVTLAMIAALMFRRLDGPELPALEERAFALALDASAPLPLRAATAMWLVVECAMRGENVRAGKIVAALRPLADAEPLDPLTAITWLSAEAVHCWHVGMPSRTSAAVAEGLALASRTGVHVWDFLLEMQSVNACLAQDDLAGARAALARGEELLKRKHAPNDLWVFEHERGLVALRAGDVDQCLESARSVLVLGDRVGAPFCAILGHTMLALSFAARRDLTAARPHLDALARLGDTMRSSFAHVVGALCDATLALDRGDDGVAREHLERGLALSREKRVMPDVWFSREQIAALCGLALEAGIEMDHARALAARLRLEPRGRAEDDERWPWPVRVRVLGSFEATVDDQPIALEGRAPRRLLDLLAAVSSAGPNGLPEHVAESGIWPESDDAHHALETSLYRLRRLLRHDVVVHHDRALRIDRRRCWVDAIALDVQLDRVSARLLRRDLEGAVSALNAAVRLYRGPLLAVRDEAWVTAARARIRRRLRRSFGDVAAHGAVEGSRAALAMAVGLDDALGPPDASFSPQP